MFLPYQLHIYFSVHLIMGGNKQNVLFLCMHNGFVPSTLNVFHCYYEFLYGDGDGDFKINGSHKLSDHHVSGNCIARQLEYTAFICSDFIYISPHYLHSLIYIDIYIYCPLFMNLLAISFQLFSFIIALLITCNFCRIQHELEVSTKQAIFVDSSISDTIRTCIVLGNHRAAMKVKTEFKVCEALLHCLNRR